MTHIMKYLDLLNTVEFVPLAVGALYLLIAAMGLFWSVAWVWYWLMM